MVALVSNLTFLTADLTDNFTQYAQHPANYITGIADGVEGALGFFANLFMVFFLVSDFKNLNPPDLIIVGICMTDCIFCLSNVFQIYHILYSNQGLGCKINGVVQYVFAASNLVFPSLAMVNRWKNLCLREYF